MATLVFAAVGTSLGGPIGGIVGGMVGRQVDATIFGGRNRDGPRLDDLRATRSTYGTAIPRQFGRMRMPGTIIWATDLVEHSETTGSGKSGGSVTIYTYSISFAVALSSRPIIGIGRVWADGDLLRGAAGDLKVGGELRVHTGHGDQPRDPLMAAADPHAPAYRGTALAVFDGLELASFGNRIPALTFEVIADEGAITLADVLGDVPGPVSASMPLPGLAGFAHEGGPLAQSIEAIDALYPLACDAGGNALSIAPADLPPSPVPMLPQATASGEDGAFGTQDGYSRQRDAARSARPLALRYYDPDRDYLAGMQRSAGHAPPGPIDVVEFPGALLAEDARALAGEAADRGAWAREAMAWRTATLDPAIRPGNIVRAPGIAGLWRVTGWEWTTSGVELELLRLPAHSAPQGVTDPGAALERPDLLAGPTVLEAFELPWDGNGSSDARGVYAAASSANAGWRGAGLHVEHMGQLSPIGAARRRSIIGRSTSALAPSPSLLLERDASLLVQLAAEDLMLAGSTVDGLAQGANRALLGGEVLQFVEADALGGGLWRLRGLLRGRGGTEHAAHAGHPPDTPFILIDASLARLDSPHVPASPAIRLAALGRGDADPAFATIANPGETLKPLSPVHPIASAEFDGGFSLRWTRRARGAWTWADEVDAPLVEESEAYCIGIGPADVPLRQWRTTEPALRFDAAQWPAVCAAYPAAKLWVRQIGRFALSDPLLLTTLP